MQYVYLDVFLNALSKLFEFIFNDILAPILKDILEVFINFFLNVIWTVLGELLLTLFSALCSLVDFIESIFNVFAGLAPVYYNDPNYAEPRQMSLLDVLFEMEAITLAFWMITLVAMGICILFTIYKTAKSISDMTLEDRNPISKVLADAMKASVTFLMIPMLCVMMLQLSSVITNQTQTAFNAAQGGDTSLGTIIFLSATMDADKKTTSPKDMLTGTIAMEKDRMPSFTDSVRKPYMNDPTLYQNLDRIKADFHPANVNYLVGFISSVLVLLILLLSIITFIRRLFELLLLYIISPFFVSTIPLDDGATFSRWRELFIAKFFSGFGMIFSMKYYMMLIPFISSSGLVLYPKDVAYGATINTILQLFIVIGGAYAVFKAQSLILELLSPEAAQAEQQSSAMLTGMVMGAVSAASGGAGAVLSGLMSAGGGGGGSSGGKGKIKAPTDKGSSGGGDSSGASQKKDDSNQAYRGK